MREILFRGKRTDNGEWVCGYYCGPFGYFDEHEICDIADPTCSRVDVDPETVGQYTGLEDKNGKRIFEGDILCKVIISTGEVNMGVVSYDDGAFGVKSQRGAYLLAFFDCGVVIGNIHDNPEMIGGKEDGT